MAATYFLLHHTIFGREVYAVGGNATAFISGVRVMRVRIAVFAIAGLLYAIGGGDRHGSAPTESTMAQATGLELSTIAAVAIGGVSLAGGRGTRLSAYRTYYRRARQPV